MSSTHETHASWLRVSKDAADAMMAEFHRVCDSYQHMEPDAMKLMPDYMQARQAALHAVAGYEAIRAHVAKAGAQPC